MLALLTALVGGAVSWIAGSTQQKEQNRYNRERENREAWRQYTAKEEEKAYNAPAAQAERLEAAGINPFYAISGADRAPAYQAVAGADYADMDVQAPIETAINLFNMSRDYTTSQIQQEVLNLQKQKLISEIVFDPARKDSEIKDKELKREVDELKRKGIQMENSMLEDEKKRMEKWDKMSFGLGEGGVKDVLNFLKTVLPIFIGRKRAR